MNILRFAIEKLPRLKICITMNEPLECNKPKLIFYTFSLIFIISFSKKNYLAMPHYPKGEGVTIL